MYLLCRNLLGHDFHVFLHPNLIDIIFFIKLILNGKCTTVVTNFNECVFVNDGFLFSIHIGKEKTP